jgi:NAD(P)-dependent dehydrogenase (short-subunit alcohol dehydrogenase family)
MDLGIEGKKALVVGGSRGMGKAVSVELHKSGSTVASVSRSGDGLKFDISVPDQIPQLIESVVDWIGIPDIVVHVAGGSGGIRDEMLPWSEWQRVQWLNLGAAHEINRVFLPIMVQRGWGRIVHFSSNGVKIASGNVPYIAAKHSVEGYVERMGRLYGPKGVVITAVAPGPIYTPGLFMYSQNETWTKAFWEKYVPMGRWGRDEEVAGAVAFLCSQHSSYMAGAIVPVDGGMR